VFSGFHVCIIPPPVNHRAMGQKNYPPIEDCFPKN
jgi:hypothetical protein